MVLKWLDKNLKWVFTIPTIIFVLAMIAFPILYTLRLSFFDSTMSAQGDTFVGLQNYTEMFTDPDQRFLQAFGRTMWFSLIAIIVEIILGVGIAVLLNRKFVGKGIARTVFLLPMVATPVAIGMVWQLIYEPNIGIANYMLSKLGMAPLEWLGSADSALWSLMLVDIWQWTPMVMLIVFAGITSLPTDPFESAYVDGANGFQVLTKITLPLLVPTILVAILLRLIDVVKTFDIIYSTTQGGPGYATETLNILSYRYAFENFQFGKSSATLMVFFVVVMTIAVIFVKVKKKAQVDY
jgi:multiple sugar transport system permease protein